MFLTFQNLVTCIQINHVKKQENVVLGLVAVENKTENKYLKEIIKMMYLLK